MTSSLLLISKIKFPRLVFLPEKFFDHVFFHGISSFLKEKGRERTSPRPFLDLLEYFFTYEIFQRVRK